MRTKIVDLHITSAEIEDLKVLASACLQPGEIVQNPSRDECIQLVRMDSGSLHIKVMETGGRVKACYRLAFVGDEPQ